MFLVFQEFSDKAIKLFMAFALKELKRKEPQKCCLQEFNHLQGLQEYTDISYR